MNCIVYNTIDFISKTFPKIYSNLYLEYLKEYAPIYNINKTQLRALMIIKNNGAISMTTLCNKLNIEKGSLTSMIDDLTNKGYVTRQRDISDRRKYFIIITKNGEDIASDFLDKLKIKLEEKLCRLDEDDQKRYIYALNTLEDILNKYYQK